MLQAVDSLELTADVELLGGGEEVLDTRVGVIVTAEDQLGLLDPIPSTLALDSRPYSGCGKHVLVRSVDILDGENGKISVVAEISESDFGTGLDSQLLDGLLVNVEVDGHGEEGAIGEAVVLNNAAEVN